jgi:hypothetical protein
MRIALIKGGVVVNVIESDEGFAQTLVNEGEADLYLASDTAGIGHTWDGETLTHGFPQKAKPHLTRLEFMQRFTLAERKTIRNASKNNQDVEDMMHMLEIATYVDLNRADTIAMVNALESAGLIGTGRAAEVLA